MFNGGHPITEAALSAYVDGELSAGERSRVERHLDGCATCRETLAGLRAVRSALQALPRATAPRSFALRQADVRPRAAARSAGWFASPALAGVAMVALVSFFSLVSVDLIVQSGGTADKSNTGAVVQPAADSFGFAEDQSERPPDDKDNRQAVGTLSGSDATATPLLPATGAPAEAGDDDDAVLNYAEATAVPLLPATAAPAETDGDDGTVLHIAEAGTAALAVVAAGAFVFTRRRRLT